MTLTSANTPNSFTQRLWWPLCLCLTGLIAVGLLWEGWLAPLRPGGSWWILKVLPLLPLLHGLLKRRRYSLQWGSMLILLYIGEASARWFSDRDPISAQLAMLSTLLSISCFVMMLMLAKKHNHPKHSDSFETPSSPS